MALKYKQKIPKIIVSILLLLVLDLITKYLFTNKTYFKDFFLFISYTQNYGSSFGIFSQVAYYQYFIILLSLMFIIGLIYNYKSFSHNRWTTLFFIFVIAGILGNTYDRILYNYVRDFLGIRHFFIFNLADFYISISFIFIIIQNIGENKTLKMQKKPK